ncbi:MAG: helix-turn-helix domain-containing protein, partial [Amphiplicatus sp.]|nr:helix-turn-helix domain-containing protein [Amphiplicatus sp.]
MADASLLVKHHALQWAAQFRGHHAAVMAAMLDFLNAGRAWPSVKTLAAVAGCSERSVQRCLRTFERHGAIKTILGGGRFSSTYRLQVDMFATSPVRENIKAVIAKARSVNNSVDSPEDKPVISAEDKPVVIPVTKLSPHPRQNCHLTSDGSGT